MNMVQCKHFHVVCLKCKGNDTTLFSYPRHGNDSGFEIICNTCNAAIQVNE